MADHTAKRSVCARLFRHLVIGFGDTAARPDPLTCQNCGYCLRGLDFSRPVTCPECGHAAPGSSGPPIELRQPARANYLIIWGSTLLFCTVSAIAASVCIDMALGGDLGVGRSAEEEWAERFAAMSRELAVIGMLCALVIFLFWKRARRRPGLYLFTLICWLVFWLTPTRFWSG